MLAREMGSGVEARRLDEVRDALSCSLDIREVLETASPILLELIPANYAALGITEPGVPGGFEWIVAKLPEKFFEAYAEMHAHDFVLRAVLAAPNRVLRDSEMIPRRELETNMMYGRARDLGMPLEHVMSTMLHVDDEWQSGVSLYRSERIPFSECDRDALASVTPALKHAVRNCRLFASVEHKRRALEELVVRHGLVGVVLNASGRELSRTDGVNALVERWFDATERKPGMLPQVLLEQARAWCALGPGAHVPAPWKRSATGAELIVRSHWILDRLEHRLLLAFHEIKDAAVPTRWQKRLTRREHEVAARVLSGWDNRLIADELGCEIDTVKKHLTSVYDKLGASSRSQLIVLARREFE
jgi:DNA-binding CsgD family transcriptional regulator